MNSTKIVRGLSQGVLSRVNNVQAQYLTEQCIAVDEQDRPLRGVSKSECHHTSSAVLHRAFSVFLFTPARELVLQKRSDTKITFPSVWTNSCCSHPLYTAEEMETEDALGVRRAAQRKLDHELGVGSIDVDRMSVMGRFLYDAKMSGGEWMEHELDYAIIIKDFDVKTLKANPEEVSEVRMVSKEGLAEMMSSGNIALIS
uniref:isopentenyl-diphosphate Delta-isomerase n=1 Tax=Steinernema glaseri TaxID=37863 RepID=A0A1I7Y8E1_9BILA